MDTHREQWGLSRRNQVSELSIMAFWGVACMRRHLRTPHRQGGAPTRPTYQEGSCPSAASLAVAHSDLMAICVPL